MELKEALGRSFDAQGRTIPTGRKNLDTIGEYHPEYLLSYFGIGELSEAIRQEDPLSLLKAEFWEEVYNEHVRVCPDASQEFLTNTSERLKHVHAILSRQTERALKGKYRHAFIEGWSGRMINRILVARGLTTTALDEDPKYKTLLGVSGFDNESEQLFHGEREQNWVDKMIDKITYRDISKSLLIIGQAHLDEFTLERRLACEGIKINPLEGFDDLWKVYAQIRSVQSKLFRDDFRAYLKKKREERAGKESEK